MKKWVAVCIIVCVMSLAAYSVPSNAQTGEVDFSVEMVPHERQVNHQVGYFDLLLEMKKSTTLELIIHNHSNEATLFELEVGNAFTNGNGVVEYNRREAVEGASLSLTDLIPMYPKELRVEANQSKRIQLRVDSLQNLSNDIVLGGIQVSKLEERTTSTEVGVNNRYVYVLGVKLATSIQQTPFEPVWEEALVNTDHYYPHVALHVRNATGSISGMLDVKMIIESEGEKIAMHQLEARMVPFTGTHFRFPVKQRLEAGAYVARMSMSDRETNQTWEWESPFTVTKEDVSLIDERIGDPTIQQSGFFSHASWLVIGAGILLIGCFGYILHLRKKIAHRV